MTIWWQRGYFSPKFGFMKAEDGKGRMLWVWRLHIGWNKRKVE